MVCEERNVAADVRPRRWRPGVFFVIPRAAKMHPFFAFVMKGGKVG